MSFSIYDVSVPVFTASLTSLSKFLAKGAAHIEAKGFAPEGFLQARLAPDMLPLPRQIQMASDGAKGAAARLAGVDAFTTRDWHVLFLYVTDLAPASTEALATGPQVTEVRWFPASGLPPAASFAHGDWERRLAASLAVAPPSLN